MTLSRVDPPLSQLIMHGLNDKHIFTIQLIVEAIDQSQTFKRKSQTVVVIQLKLKEMQKLNEIEFIPLPKSIFISSAKSIGSTILK